MSDAKTPTLAAARAHCRALGMTVRSDDGEYRLTALGSTDEGPAYYSDCLVDIMGTATAIAEERGA